VWKSRKYLDTLVGQLPAECRFDSEMRDFVSHEF
jgi:hypothetical protein